MIDTLLSILAPHHCCSCGQTGRLLCDNCKYNIISELKTTCLACGRPSGAAGVCNTCRVPYQQAWCVGDRKDVLQRLIGLYKFKRTRSAYRVLAELLLETLPVLPSDTVIVPLPTVAGHVRERGYDHTALIARYVAKRRGLRYRPVIKRATHTTQRHSNAAQRISQAKHTFAVESAVNPNVTYVIIDDIVTTGASIRYAAQALRDAGATRVWVAVIARQILD